MTILRKPTSVVMHLHCVTAKRNRGDLAIVAQIQADLRRRRPGLRFEDVDLLALGRDSALRNARRLGRPAMVLIGGGGIYSRFFPLRRQNLCWLGFLRRCGVPVVLVAPGFAGQADGPPPAAIVRAAVALNRLAALRSVRDAYSQAILATAGVGDCPCIGDPALFGAREADRPAAREKVVGFNVADHGWRAGRIEDWPQLPAIFDCARRLRDEGYGIRYFMHSDLELDVARRFERELGAEIVDRLYPEILAEYRRLSGFAGMMLHSTIMAASCDVPVVSLAYDAKNAAFMEMLGLGRFVVPAASLEPGALHAAVHAAIDAWPRVCRPAAEKRSQLMRAYDEFLDNAAALVA